MSLCNRSWDNPEAYHLRIDYRMELERVRGELSLYVCGVSNQLTRCFIRNGGSRVSRLKPPSRSLASKELAKYANGRRVNGPPIKTLDFQINSERFQCPTQAYLPRDVHPFKNLPQNEKKDLDLSCERWSG